ncbi:MAG TPA: hypothetical protein DHV28_08545 [Ignavibacteriales bacterium]|nr:hypothetical protein [Ignavibacteriales bacterium]
MVWSEQLSSISQKYYISENTLQKKCTELHIPLPSIRYWISLKPGNKPQEKIPLGEFSGYSTFYLKLREEVESVKVLVQQHLLRIKTEIENDTNINLKVPDRLTNPDPLIAAAKDGLYKDKIMNKEEGLIHSNYGKLAIYVSPNNLARALRIMDTIIKALKNRGHNFINKNGSTYISIFGQQYWISFKEKEKRVVVKGKYGETSKYESTGILSFRLGESYHLKEWSEGKTPFEEKISTILTGIEYQAWKDREERIENEKRWAIQREKERIAKELQERKDKELADFKELFKKSKRHEEAEIIRRYIQKLEDSAISKNELNEELKQKIEWARKKADWYDPFIEANDELLIDVNREDLTMAKRGYW